MPYTDSHAHLSGVAEELGLEALAAVLGAYAGTAAAGAMQPLLLDPGTEPEDLSERAALICRATGDTALPAFLRLAAGVWPSAENLSSPCASLEALAASVSAASRRGVGIAAIGEAGLDYHHMAGPRRAQAELLEGHAELAARLGLPLIVHSRDAASDTLAVLASARRPPRILIHCFGYGPDEARAFLDQGAWISFAGNLTYKGSAALREACALVPPDRLLLETDAPYMCPVPRRGRASTPLDIERTYLLAAELRGEGLAELAETVSRNAQTLFG